MRIMINQRCLVDESLIYVQMIEKRDGHGFRTILSYLRFENEPQPCHGRASHVVIEGVGAGPAMLARTRRCGKIPVPIKDLI